MARYGIWRNFMVHVVIKVRMDSRNVFWRALARGICIVELAGDLATYLPRQDVLLGGSWDLVARVIIKVTIVELLL